MADKNIGSLPNIADLSDDAMLVAEQQGEAGQITGRQLKEYARAGVEQYVTDAQEAANAAAASAGKANETVEQIGTAVEDTQAAQKAAENARDEANNARDAIENMQVEAITLGSDEPASVNKETEEGVVKLVFGLPKGEPGGQGEKGDPGSYITSIDRTAGTGAAGTTDTYTITMSDGATHTFQVTNGADGIGSGDMSKSVYDPQGRSTDIFQYVDERTENIQVPSSLPEVSEANNGDFLCVVNGVWAATTVQSAEEVSF